MKPTLQILKKSGVKGLLKQNPTRKTIYTATMAKKIVRDTGMHKGHQICSRTEYLFTNSEEMNNIMGSC